MTNPYAPTSAPLVVKDIASERLQSVSRIFVWIGLLGTLIYIPIVVGCVVSLLAQLTGHPIGNPKIRPTFVFAVAILLINSAFLFLWLTFIVTGRQIKKRMYAVRTRALALSILLSFGFPILTIPGVMCFRWLRQYFHADAATRDNAVDHP